MDGEQDLILGFNVDEGDHIFKNSVDENYVGPDPLAITSVEVGGFTTFKVIEKATGSVVETLVVDAVGIPPIDNYLLG